MTTSKYEESIKDLTSNDDNKRLKALRFIKNSVIGNKTKKDLYIKLGVVQKYGVHECSFVSFSLCLKELDILIGIVLFDTDLLNIFHFLIQHHTILRFNRLLFSAA